MPESDPFHLHRLALRPALADLSASAFEALLGEIPARDRPGFADFLNEQGLSSFWHQCLFENGVPDKTVPDLTDALKPQRLADAMLYMAQKAALQQVDALFEAGNIAYAVIKGAHVRELVYPDPAVRSAGDIDILVRPVQRETAAQILLDAGFRLHAEPENISHEATFIRGQVAIDLHWDILRPGRTRIPVADQLLERRQRAGDHWGLSDTDAVFLMLVHPAFAKYVCSPAMGLNRVLDFVLWLNRKPIDWTAVAAMLERTGLKTAAWAVLVWVGMLAAPSRLPVPDTFIATIRPGRLRSRYLHHWIRRNLPTRWMHKSLLIQVGFTLLLHDRPADAVHAVAGWLRAMRSKRSDPLLQLPDASTQQSRAR